MQGRPLDRVLVLNITIVVEALLLLLATLWSQFGEIRLLPLFHLNRNVALIGVLSGLIIGSSGFLLFWAATKFGPSIKWLGTLRNIVNDDLMPLFHTLNAADIILVAASSGFCEEIFFRGVIQDQLKLWLAAALFGFFHCPTPRHLPYGIWAFCAGLFLGWLLQTTGSIWTPIFAHALSNFLVLMYLRYGRKPVVSAESTDNSEIDPEAKVTRDKPFEKSSDKFSDKSAVNQPANPSAKSQVTQPISNNLTGKATALDDVKMPDPPLTNSGEKKDS